MKLKFQTETKDFTLAFEVRYAKVLVSPAKRIISHFWPGENYSSD